MQSGELIVTGKDSIHIPLNHMPAEVKCRFKTDIEMVPCNPHHVDWLEATVHTSNTCHSGLVLLIKWHVEGVREIVWEVLY